MRDVQVSVDEDIIDKAEELVEQLGKEIFAEFGQHKTIKDTTKKSEQKMVFSNSTQTYIPTEEKCRQKKWSTFLMKPERPMPISKRAVEEKKMKEDSYKIIIKKQSRRKSLPKEKRVQFDLEVENLSDRSAYSPDVPFSPEPDSLGSLPDPDSLEDANDENKLIENENDYDDDDEDKEKNSDDDSYCQYDKGHSDDDDNNFDNLRKDSLGIELKPLSEIIVDTNLELGMTLEEQLRAVQKQLQALSQLPSAVQLTLDAVSKQLAEIVSNKENSEDANEDYDNEEDDNNNDKDEGTASAAEAAEAESGEDTNSIVGDELDEDSLVEEELQAIMERAKLTEERDEDEDHEDAEDINAINEEELEAQRKEEELLVKKEKVHQWNNSWPWSDTVKPVYRINFMKYTPPPRNLDHLQRSEVYRMIHGMEPPTRGIVTRPEKILPEQDYYEATKEHP